MVRCLVSNDTQVSMYCWHITNVAQWIFRDGRNVTLLYNPASRTNIDRVVAGGWNSGSKVFKLKGTEVLRYRSGSHRDTSIILQCVLSDDTVRAVTTIA